MTSDEQAAGFKLVSVSRQAGQGGRRLATASPGHHSGSDNRQDTRRHLKMIIYAIKSNKVFLPKCLDTSECGSAWAAFAIQSRSTQRWPTDRASPWPRPAVACMARSVM